MPAVRGYDYEDGSSGTRAPNPLTANIEAVLSDGSRQVWRDDDIPAVQSLSWDGSTGTFHIGSNGTVGILVCVRSRNTASHDVTVSTSGFSGLTVTPYSARYITQTCVSFFGQLLYSNNIIARALRIIPGLSVAFANRFKANKAAPAILDDDVLTATVPSEGNQCFWVDVYVPKGTSAGTISGSILLDEGGNQAVLPVSIVVRDFELPDENAKPNLVYIPKDVGLRTVGPDATQTNLDDWLDEGFRELRKHGFDPVSGDNTVNGLPDPDPQTRQLARLDGSIYSGGAYRGASAHSWDIIGIYNDLLGWTGVDVSNDDATNTAAVGARLAARNATLSTAGLTIETGGYTIDESAVETAQQRALWYDEATYSVKPMATFSTTNGYLIEFALPELPALSGQGGGQGTAITWAVGTGHVVPKQSKDVWQAARDSGYRVGWYNGQLPARGSMMQEEDWLNQSLNFVIDAIDGNNIWFGWNSVYHFAFEVSDVSGKPDAGWTPTTGPAPGVVDPKRQNANRYDHTFGNRQPLDDDDLGINRLVNNRTSSGDGWFMVPKSDFYYSDDPYIPGTVGFFPMTKLKAYRRGIQTEVLIDAARTANQSATDALLTAFKPKTPFDVGAGDTGDANVFNDATRSYIGAASPDARVHLEDISSDDYVKLERDLYDILEA